MKKFITYLSLTILFIIGITFSFAQQNQNTQKSDPEVEVLKKRISELESKLQTVESVEKMELAAKLADANAKLLNAEIDRFKRELKDANDEWLRTWSLWFVGITGFLVLIVGGAFWFWLRSRADQLIANSVEKSLDGFKETVAQVDTLKNELKEAVGQVNILQDQIRILEREHAASVLEGSVHLPDGEGRLYSETIKALPDGGLLDLIADKTRSLDFRYKAAEVLAVRKNPKLVPPVLELLNWVVDSKVNWDNNDDLERSWYHICLRNLVDFLGQFHTQEAYEGLTEFLNRLLTENPKSKDLFLTWTVFSLVRISVGLNKRDPVSVLRGTVPDLKVLHYQDNDLRVLAEYFDKFDEPEGIKDILTNGVADRMPEVETRCLELLQNHDPDFVREWKEARETANTQSKESS